MTPPDLLRAWLEELEPGTRFATATRTVTESDVTVFAALTGDRHPQHTDPAWAAGSRFGERVAHGMLVASCAVGLVPFDPERVVALRQVRDLVFKRPVALGDAIAVDGTIAAVERLDERNGLVGCRLRVRNQHDRLVARMTLDAVWRARASAVEDGAAGSFVPIPL